MTKRRKLLSLLIVSLFFIAIFMIMIHADLRDVNNIKSTLAELGKLSPVLFVALCALRSFMLLPCGLFSATGGVLFGPVKGTLLTLAGFTLNALILYYAANYLGRDWVKRLLKDKFVYLDNYVSKNSFFSCFLLRVVPLLPFDAVSCIAGISKARIVYYTAATILGSIPGVFVYAYFGDSLKNLSFEKIVIPGISILIMTCIPLAYKLFKHKHCIERSINKDNNTTI